MTSDLFPHILVDVVDIQRKHLLLLTPLLNKTLRLSSAWMFVSLFRLLLIHCIHVSVTKPTCTAFSAWLNTGSAWSLKVTGKAVELCSMALSSKLWAALHGQYIVDSMCICKKCRSLDLSVLMGMPSWVVSDHGTGPRRNDSVNSWSDQSCSFLCSHLADYVL